jgi:Spy/CpxP family protein refolding chaperone
VQLIEHALNDARATMTRQGAFILVAGLLLGAPLHAQSHQHNHAAPQQAQAAAHDHGAEGGMKCDMNDAVHRSAPKKLLEHREMLQLTAPQIAKLEALQAAHHDDCNARMERVKAAEAAAAAALELAAPDVALFEAKSREAANLKIDCKVDMVRKGQEAAALLTPAQRAHLAHMSAGHGGH